MQSGNSVYLDGNSSRDEICAVSSRAELVRELSRARIPLVTWQSEEIQALWREVEAGDAVLVVRYGTTLVRKVQDVRALVRFERFFANGVRNKRNVYTLVEAARVSDRGARRHYSHAAYSLGTQIHRNETPFAALRRLFRENLCISGMPRSIRFLETRSETGTIFSGLVSEVLYRLYEVELDQSQFKPDGYCGADTATRQSFEWKCSHHVDGPAPNNRGSRRNNVRPRTESRY